MFFKHHTNRIYFLCVLRLDKFVLLQNVKPRELKLINFQIRLLIVYGGKLAATNLTYRKLLKKFIKRTNIGLEIKYLINVTSNINGRNSVYSS